MREYNPKTVKTFSPDTRDEDLLRACRDGGETEKLGDLYARYIPLVYGVALKYLRDSGESAALVLKIYQELPARVAEERIVCFRPWLYAWVREACLEELKKRTKGKVRLDEEVKSYHDNFDIDHIREDSDKKKVLLKQMEALPEKQRVVIQRFFLENRSYREIGDMTGFSLERVKELICEGERALREKLAEKGIY